MRVLLWRANLERARAIPGIARLSDGRTEGRCRLSELPAERERRAPVVLRETRRRVFAVEAFEDRKGEIEVADDLAFGGGRRFEPDASPFGQARIDREVRRDRHFWKVVHEVAVSASDDRLGVE